MKILDNFKRFHSLIKLSVNWFGEILRTLTDDVLDEVGAV